MTGMTDVREMKSVRGVKSVPGVKSVRGLKSLRGVKSARGMETSLLRPKSVCLILGSHWSNGLTRTQRRSRSSGKIMSLEDA